MLCVLVMPCFAMKNKKPKYDKKKLHTRSVQAKELNAAANAAMACVEAQNIGRYANVITKSDCDEIIKTYRDLALKNQNNS